jgi:sulfite reductase (NADPH) flavoprotein alpha-component
MLTENKLIAFKDLVNKVTREELIWINGYVSGILEQNNITQTRENTVIETVNLLPISNGILPKPTIIYGTETGNSKKIASQLQAFLKKNKISAKVFDASQYPLEKIEQEELLLIVMSTQGEGEPPQSAAKFFNALHDRNFNLQNTKFAVFGLGDTSYPLFCQAAADVDGQLEKLGAKRILELQKTDVDFAATSQKWIENIANILVTEGNGLKSILQENSSNRLKSVIQENGLKSVLQKTYSGIIKHKVVLNDRGSNKETYHIEIANNEKVTYSAGDALGIYPKNDTKSIEKVLQFFDTNAIKNLSEITEILATKSIRNLGKKTISALATLFEITISEEKIDLIEFLTKYKSNSNNKQNIDIQQVIALLNPITPRLYSISSAPDAHENEVHLTVGLHKFKVNDTEKIGLASDFLANYPKNTQLDFYIHKNPIFKLPAEDKDIIMIGAGTGIAPFRSFLFQRDAENASGKNWLIFGEQHFALDFYYQTEIQEFLSTGVLTKLDTAFSRDTKEKIYVQHRLKQQANTLYEWLENGAYLYICGQKNPMSIDVENTIIEIIAEKSKVSIEKATEKLAEIEAEGRYLKDVY